MYVLNEVLVFGLGRRKEALERLSWIHGLMSPHDGFKQAIVAKYLGDSLRHTIMRFWEDEEAYQAFRATPDGNYGRSRPEGIYTGERVIGPLVSYGEVNGNAAGNFYIKVQREVPAAAWSGLLDQQKAMLDLAPSLSGLVWARQLRAKDQDQALVVARFRSREDFENMIDSTEYVELQKKVPESVNLVRTECFEIVSDIGPKK